MAVDLSGGFPDSREFVFPKQPDNPEMRESVNAWIWDDGSDYGLPRIGIEALADQWDTHDIQLNIAFADGYVVNLYGTGAVHDAAGSDGEPRILGAGGLSFELIEPYKHWKMRYDGLGIGGRVEDRIAGEAPSGEPDVPVNIEIDIFAAVPPWENGEMLPEAKRVLETQDEGGLMGGPRFEQLSRAKGTVQVGDRHHTLEGGALRIRRSGVRTFGTFRGHAWQSSIFPSGRGFGYIVYPPRDDGLNTYNEGYIFDGDGELTPAWVVDAPWLRRPEARGQDVSVVLETEAGRHEIKGESVVSAFSVMRGIGTGEQGWPVLQQAICHYTWDGEEANGMMERSTVAEKLER